MGNHGAAGVSQNAGILVVIIGSGNVLLMNCQQSVTQTNADLLLLGPSETNCNITHQNEIVCFQVNAFGYVIYKRIDICTCAGLNP